MRLWDEWMHTEECEKKDEERHMAGDRGKKGGYWGMRERK